MYAKGGVPSGTTKAIIRSATNDSGSILPKLTPIRLTSTGISTINVSNEASSNAILGLVQADVPIANIGSIVIAGVVEDITTSASIGDIMYVSKTGGLTNSKPSQGVSGFVSGDWVIRVGVIAPNNDNLLLRDILVNVQIVGVL
jgi:hypothetical protein